MKKISKIFAVIMLALCSTFTFVSCNKSNEALINEYENLCKEIVTAHKDGNSEKVLSLTNECRKVVKELASRELTAGEQKRIQDISMDMVQSGFSPSEANDLINGMAGESNSLNDIEDEN